MRKKHQRCPSFLLIVDDRREWGWCIASGRWNAFKVVVDSRLGRSCVRNHTLFGANQTIWNRVLICFRTFIKHLINLLNSADIELFIKKTRTRRCINILKIKTILKRQNNLWHYQKPTYLFNILKSIWLNRVINFCADSSILQNVGKKIIILPCITKQTCHNVIAISLQHIIRSVRVMKIPFSFINIIYLSKMSPTCFYYLYLRIVRIPAPISITLQLTALLKYLHYKVLHSHGTPIFCSGYYFFLLIFLRPPSYE